MGKLSNLKKTLNKMGVVTELSEPDQWGCFGNVALNYIATGSFTKGIPNRRMVMMYGMPGTGKSLLMGKIVKNVQDQGYQVIYIDTEDAIDAKFLMRIGVDVNDGDTFQEVRSYTIEEVGDVVSTVFREFGPEEKIAIFIDSLGMLETNDHFEEYEKKGILKNDMGLLAKKTKKLLKNINSKVGSRDCFFVVNQHAYKNQDLTNGQGTIIPSGGEAQIFIPSISMMLKKLDLKDGKEISGVRVIAQAKKTRFTKLGGKVELEIPWSTGIDYYEGALDILEKICPYLEKNGGWYTMTLPNEDPVKFQKSGSDAYVAKLIAMMDTDQIIEDIDSDIDLDTEETE